MKAKAVHFRKHLVQYLLLALQNFIEDSEEQQVTYSNGVEAVLDLKENLRVAQIRDDDVEARLEEWPPEDIYGPARVYLIMNMRDSIRKTAARLADEYIEESEHQDGFGYWERFADQFEAQSDFKLYVANTVD